MARLISLVESAHPSLREVMAVLAPDSGHAHVVGLTGAPGVGKSTTTTGLVAALRARGQRVGVLAVDPSSPFSGGALLGDRIRMEEHALDPEVFLRSMATRGQLGGLAAAAPQAVRVLDAAGCDVVLVETVGVGQSEVEVARLADTTLVLLAPGAGDGIQSAKAGILEIGDVFVVNKADREGAEATVRELRHMVSLGGDASDAPEGTTSWRPPVVRTVASRSTGIDALLEAVDAHREWLDHDGRRRRRRVARAAGEVEALALAGLRERMSGLVGGPMGVLMGGDDPSYALVDELAADVAAGRTDAYAAAETLVAALTRRP